MRIDAPANRYGEHKTGSCRSNRCLTGAPVGLKCILLQCGSCG